MMELFSIFTYQILADRVAPENIHSEYASAKQLYRE